MAITIKDLVGRLFDRNPNISVQNLFQSFKGLKNNKKDTEITFYTAKENAPSLDFQSGCFYGKTALIIWVDTEELNLAMAELEKEKGD